MRGPFNPTQNDECGLQVEGFGMRPYFGMPYNPPSYVDVYESLGLQKARDLLAYKVDPSLQEGFDRRLRGLSARVQERLGITVRPVDVKRRHEEARLITRLFNESLAEEWNFMPLTVDVAEAFASDLAGHLDPEAILIAEANGELRLDVCYVDHRSLGLDLKILLLTGLKVLTCEGIRHKGSATMPEFMGTTDEP